METKSDVTANPTGEANFSVNLHPLVIMNIADHYTRSKVSNSGTIKIFGAILGSQKGRNAEICNSFELLVTPDGYRYKLDANYFTSKRQQFKQVFPDLEFLGWYTNCEEPEDSDADFHQQVCQDNESYLLLTLNTATRTSELPVTIYESLIDIVAGQPKVGFSQVSYTLATEEAERVGVDHIAKETVASGGQTSVVTDHLTAHYGAIKMLYTRVRLVVDYLKAVQKGVVPKNQAILREISNLCHQLPILTSPDFTPEHLKV
jgi:COP9 signalosome complex subunit 6